MKRYLPVAATALMGGILLSACTEEKVTTPAQEPKVEEVTTPAAKPDPEMQAPVTDEKSMEQAAQQAGVADANKGSTQEEAAQVLGNKAADVLMISDPFVRAVPPGQKNSASFMTINNPSDQDFSVVKASSSVADVVELHTHTKVDGVMQMRQVPQIDVKAKQTTALKPGGLHVMLIGLKQDLKEGEQVTVELTFNDDSTQSITMPVKMIAMKMKHGKEHSHDMSAHGKSE